MENNLQEKLMTSGGILTCRSRRMRQCPCHEQIREFEDTDYFCVNSASLKNSKIFSILSFHSNIQIYGSLLFLLDIKRFSSFPLLLFLPNFFSSNVLCLENKICSLKKYFCFLNHLEHLFPKPLQCSPQIARWVLLPL